MATATGTPRATARPPVAQTKALPSTPRSSRRRRRARQSRPRLTTNQAEPEPAAPLGAAGSFAPEIAARIEETARRLLADLDRAPVGSPSFERALRTIDRIGDREIHASTAIAARYNERRLSTGSVALSDQALLARHVREVRELARGFVRLGATSRPSD